MNRLTQRLFGLVLATGTSLALLNPLAPAQAQEVGVTTDTITLGQSTALSGPLGDLGQEVLKGAKVYFDALNAKGGVHGRKVLLVSQDDAYDPQKTLQIIEGMAAAQGTFALFGTFGTPNNEALLPVAQKAGLPVIMPFTGALSVRSGRLAGVYNLRASYADEADKLVQHVTTIGFKKIAIAYQNNTFGQEVLAAATAALAQRKLEPVAVAPVENNASDAVAATAALMAAQPDALILGLAGKPSIEVIKAVNKQHRGLQMYALSVLASAANLKALGPDGVGVAISQVVPFPTRGSLPVVRDYQAAMTAAGHTEFSHLSLEGYMNARALTEALRRAGPKLTREGLVAAFNGMKDHDMGGVVLNFGKGAHSASRLVELTVVGNRGNLVK